MTTSQVTWKSKTKLSVIAVISAMMSALLNPLLLSESLSYESQGHLQSKDAISFSFIKSAPAAVQQVFGDFDSDGIEEFLWQGTDRKGALLMNFDGVAEKPSCHLRGPWHVAHIRAFDLTGDPSPEIFLCMKEDDSTWIEIYDVFVSQGVPHCSLLLRTAPISGPDLNGDGKWDGRAEPREVLDVNADGKKDVLAGIVTDYDRNPRGVSAFDGTSGRELWRYLTAGPPQYISVADINADGVEEVVFATWAPSNRNVLDDMDDSHSYLICLSREGQLKWKEEMGGVYSGCRYAIGDVDNDGQNEIVCTYAIGDIGSELTKYQLQILEGATGKVQKHFPLPTRFGFPFLADLDRDQTNEIIVTNENRTIYVFDERLRPDQQLPLPSDFGPCGISQIADVNQDGEQEIIACASNNILIFNGELQLLGRHQTIMCPWLVHFFEHPHYGGLLSVIQGEGECVTGSFIKMELKTGAERAIAAISKHGFVSFVIIFLCGIGISLVVVRIGPSLTKRLRSSEDRKAGDRRDKLLTLLSVFGHGKTATANLDRLNLLFKNLPKNEVPSSEYKGKLDESVKTYFEFTSHQLTELIKGSRSAGIDGRHAELLEETLMKLESLIGDYRKQGVTQGRIERLSQGIPVTVESLDEKIESLWNELARYYSCDPIATVQEVLAAVAPEMRKEDVKFKDLHVEGDMGAQAFVAKSDFAAVFEELLSNAIYSMKETTKKEMVAKISIGEKKISVEVSDTGCGIKREAFLKVFDREYSTKKEGGFGLYHAKATLNKYGGKIKVVQSQLGVGTTMQIEVKRI